MLNILFLYSVQNVKYVNIINILYIVIIKFAIPFAMIIYIKSFFDQREKVTTVLNYKHGLMFIVPYCVIMYVFMVISKCLYSCGTQSSLFPPVKKELAQPISIKEARSVSLYPYNQHNFCKMLSILNKLTLQEDLQNFVTNSVFIDKK